MLSMLCRLPNSVYGSIQHCELGKTGTLMHDGISCAFCAFSSVLGVLAMCFRQNSNYLRTFWMIRQGKHLKHKRKKTLFHPRYPDVNHCVFNYALQHCFPPSILGPYFVDTNQDLCVTHGSYNSQARIPLTSEEMRTNK